MAKIIRIERCVYQTMTRASSTGWRRCRRMGKPITMSVDGFPREVHLCLKCCAHAQAGKGHATLS